jgi:hypothetical protein
MDDGLAAQPADQPPGGEVAQLDGAHSVAQRRGADGGELSIGRDGQTGMGATPEAAAPKASHEATANRRVIGRLRYGPR